MSEPQRTKFVADAMLGSLARKLRALGFDTSYFRSGEDSALLDMARKEARVILTADRILAARADGRGLNAILVTGNTDGARLRAIAAAAKASGLSLVPGDSLCAVCGGALRALNKRDVAGRVPPSVERRHRQFYVCASCGKLYWRGSHWKKLRSFARGLRVR